MRAQLPCSPRTAAPIALALALAACSGDARVRTDPASDPIDTSIVFADPDASDAAAPDAPGDSSGPAVKDTPPPTPDDGSPPDDGPPPPDVPPPDEIVAPPAPGVGEIVISEVMHSPLAGGAAWVELYGAAAEARSLTGCAIADHAGAQVTLGALEVSAGGYVALASAAVGGAGANHPLELVLAASGTLLVICDAQVIDEVSWDAGIIWPFGEGAALSLDPGALDADENDSAASWCLSKDEYAPGEYGTPAGTNPPCPVPDTIVDWCRFEGPAEIEAEPGELVALVGLVEEAGLTDKTDGVDAGAGLVAQAGYGPAGSDPDGNLEWAWADAQPTADWAGSAAGEPGRDSYTATLSAPELGNVATAYRFSLDEGLSWTHCDRNAGPGSDGAEDGYQPKNAGSLSVAGGGCDPNPCTKPPPPECTADGLILTTFDSPGECALIAGQVKCAYEPVDTVCGLALPGGTCQGGACVAGPDPCAPNPCQDPPMGECDDTGTVLTGWEGPGECAPDGAGGYECAFMPVTIDCYAELGQICEGGACVGGGPHTPAPGEVIVTELMYDPHHDLLDENAEWIELMNVSSGPRTLEGCSIEDSAAVPVALGPVVIEAGAFALLARSDDEQLNGGLPAVAATFGFSLTNTGDTVRLACVGVTIDEVSYDDGGAYPDAHAASVSLSADALDAEANDAAASWCLGEAAYYMGATSAEDNLGTPGAANPACPEVKPDPADWCRLQYPVDAEVGSGEPLVVYGRVYEEGITDQSSGADADSDLVGQVGYGPAEDPADNPAWTWIDAAPNPSWDDVTWSEPNNDEYMATLTGPAPGEYALAYRFSADAGKTWAYCDRNAGEGSDGAADGYQVANAGTLTTTSSAPTAGEGAVVITEIMYDTESPLLESDAEWFELHNPTDATVSLAGCLLQDSKNQSVLGPVQLAAGAWVVLGKTDELAANGGITPVATFGFGLNNTGGDIIRIVCKGETVDEVNYGADGFPYAKMAALSLSPAALSAASNDDASAWCLATVEYTTGITPHFGTPAAPNPACAGAP